MSTMEIAETTPLMSSKSNTQDNPGQKTFLRSGNFQHYIDPSIMESSMERSLSRQDHETNLAKDTNNNKQGEERGSLNFFRNLSRKKKFMIVLCTITNILEGCGFSLLAPFFPQEASKKGMPVVLTGFVFSMFELIILVTSPMFGAYLMRLGPKFVVISGTFVGGVCTMLFGTLDKCPPGTPFIVISILCRSIGAFGFSGVLNAVIAMLSSEFPQNVGSCFALLETAFSIGMMVGPAIGGGLYELGGFGVPFYVVGGLVILKGSIMSAVLPNPEDIPRDKKKSQFSLLRSPMVVIPMMSISSGTIGIAFLDPTLANHLSHFGLSVAIISLFFMIVPCSYTILSPVLGVLSDKTAKYTYLIVIGHLLFGLGFLIVGPSKIFFFVPFELWTVVIGLVVIGCNFGCCIIPTMKCMVVGAVESGFEENIETYAIVAGLVNSMYSLGAFLGPMIGGVLVQELGFAMAVTVLGLWNIFMCVLTLAYFLSRHLRSKPSYTALKKSESTCSIIVDSTFVSGRTKNEAIH